MSYDIDVGREWFNYTSNMAPFFYDHIPAELSEKGGLFELNGLRGNQAADVLDATIERIHSTYCCTSGVLPFRQKYDAPNGWGSTEGAILFLARLATACRRQPRSKVSVSA